MTRMADVSPTPAIAIVGPTASGKTRRAVAIAAMTDGEIISADSRQVYRGMSLGTGKDLDEYGAIPYHLIDIADAGERYNLHRYVTDFRAVEADIRQRHKTPVICGGSGMYVETVLAGVTLPQVPENSTLRAGLEGKSLEELTEILASMKRLHNIPDVDTATRAIRAIEIEQYYLDHPAAAAAADRSTATPMQSVIVGIDIDRDNRRKRITQRLHERLEAGMLDEVRHLLDSGIAPADLIYYGLEYKYLTEHIIGLLTYDEMFTLLETAIHQFAKRQMTWFRGMERRGFEIHWLPYDMADDEFADRVNGLLRTC